VRADRGQLENVLINLCVNARDAMPRGGALSIDLRNVVLDDSYSDVQEEVRPGPYVMMAVSDTGTGMSEDTKRRAFEPFFTTKEVGKGSGLGLSTAYGFVKQSGGHITLYSEVGFGTTVRLYFPRAEGEQPSTQTVTSPEIVSSPGHETILLVEDDADVRQLTVDMLQELGYATLEAENADRALAHLDTHPDIAMMITDVVMPGMNGRLLANEVRIRRPGLPVLFTTGYTRNAIVHHGVLDPDVHVIIKPYTLETLAMNVRTLLRPNASNNGKTGN
jgi:CheY-like chemotaxis protein